MNTGIGFLDEMYHVRDSDREPFGEHWCGPAVLSRDWTLIASYAKDPEDGDGQPVEVYCSALPARFYRIDVLRFYRIDVLAAPNTPGFSLATGSGMGEFAAEFARQVARGMVGLRSEL